MARVKAFSVEGLDLRFFSNDHDPPHFHALHAGGGWEVSVHFLEASESMLVGFRPPARRMAARHRRALVNGAECHRAALLLEWESIRDGN